MQPRFSRLFALFAAGAFAACGDTSNQDIEVVSSSEAVINLFQVAGESESGVSEGFNLDGFVSDQSDGRTCYQTDFRSPSGEEGIDNALAKLLPLIDIAGEGALEGLLQQAVNEGRLLLIFQIEELNNGNYNIRLVRGDDIPLLGTDGLVLSDQTLSLHEDPNLAYFENAIVTDGIIRAGPMKMHLPVVIFNILYELDLTNAYIEFQLTDDKQIKNGRMAGAVTMQQFISLAQTASGRTKGLEQLLAGGISDAADLQRDENGECQSLSMGVTFSGVPSFTF